MQPRKAPYDSNQHGIVLTYNWLMRSGKIEYVLEKRKAYYRCFSIA